MSSSRPMRPAMKFLLIVLVLGGAFALFMRFKDQILPSGNTGSSSASVKVNGKEPLRVCVVTWGGYAGGQYFNGGFKASKESRYFKQYGLLVEFVVIDDFNPSRDAWKAGKVDLLWITADAFPTEAAALSIYEPKIVFQADWSRGGDLIVGTRAVISINDLKGKKVAVAFGTPSHSFLLWMLEAAGMNYSDITIVEAPSAVDAASYFKAGRVDAAVVWSPDDQDCIAKVPGAHILKSTKEASNIIADVFYAKREFVEKHPAELKALIEGWMIGAAEINSDPLAKDEAVRILVAGLSQPEGFMRTAINNVRLCTYGDNVNFFDLNGGFTGVKGEDLYLKTGAKYQQIGMAPASLPSWRAVTDISALRSIKDLSGPSNQAEPQMKFAQATPTQASAPASATKRLSVNFATGSSTLDPNAQSIIDMGFADIAKTFSNNRIRIVGNTDNVGSHEGNMALSRRRAEAVANFLIQQYRFDRNRFIIIGNGPDNPVPGADNSTEEGRARNRRTDFELLQ